MRIGVIGAGRIGVHHAGARGRLREVTSLIIADVVAWRAESLSDQHPGVTAAGIDQVLAEAEAVLITSSTDTAVQCQGDATVGDGPTADAQVSADYLQNLAGTL